MVRLGILLSLTFCLFQTCSLCFVGALSRLKEFVEVVSIFDYQVSDLVDRAQSFRSASQRCLLEI